MKRTKVVAILVLGLMICATKVSAQTPLGTAFTYQGFLKDAKGGTPKPADGSYDFMFELYDDPNVIDGNQVGSTIDINDLEVIDGYFTVLLDFGGGIFTGDARWLETTVAQSDGSDPCTLSPRQELTPTPYTLYALNAEDANTVDGHHAGNLPAQVAVSNSTVCTNLNADMLDGHHAGDFAATGHNHNGSDITSGIVDEAYIDNDITRDSELAGGLASKADVGHAHDVGSVPWRGIIMWSGSIANIPSGWALCDGTNGTPDLRDSFIVGAGSSYDVNDIGGSSTHKHDAGGYSASNHTHGAGNYEVVLEQGYNPEGGNWSPYVEKGTYPISGTSGLDGEGTISGTSGDGSSLPPYFALAYIMRLP